MKNPQDIIVCHITTVHPASDVRIFYKECVSAVKAGFDTYLIVRHEKDETVDGVKILSLPLLKARGFGRLVNCIRALKKAVRLNADIYQFHDPELLPVGMALKLFTRGKVIYDVHEDIQKHALGKSWFAPAIRKFLGAALRSLERLGESFFDAIFLAEDSYKSNFRKQSLVVYNYPVFKNYPVLKNETNRNTLIYVGVIRKKRGVFEMIEAVESLAGQFKNVRLFLIGQFFPAGLKKEVKRKITESGLEKNVVITGRLNYQNVFEYLQESDIGLALLHSDGNYVNSLPTKMFEYMMLSKPVVVSNFPLWEEIVREAQCGLTVDPYDPAEIAEKIARLLRDSELRKEMGENGRRAVEQKYNWSSEEEKLISCYRQLI